MNKGSFEQTVYTNSYDMKNQPTSVIICEVEH